MNVLYFGYSWAPDLKLDSYQQSIVDHLVNSGFRVHVLLGNRFTETNGIDGFTGDVSALARYIQKNNIKVVICKNNAGNLMALRRRVGIPFIIWSSDEFSHLFRPDGGTLDGFSQFLDESCQLFVTSTACEKLYKSRFPDLESNIHLISHCTNPDIFRTVNFTGEMDVSFVGSSLDLGPIYHGLRHFAAKKNGIREYRAMLEAVGRLKADYYHDFEETINELALGDALVEVGLDVGKFKMFASNLISNNERFQVMSALSRFKTAVYGNLGWLDSMNYTMDLAHIFRAGEKVSSFLDLVKVYQSSKLSISIPQHQVGASLQYRVFDIMASDSLLIMKKSTSSDLYRYFGEDCPVPTYETTADLLDLCEKILGNEPYRRELVAKCQALITQEYRFDYRIRQMLNQVGLPSDIGVAGTLIYPDHNQFIPLKHRTRAFLGGLKRGITRSLVLR